MSIEQQHSHHFANSTSPPFPLTSQVLGILLGMTMPERFKAFLISNYHVDKKISSSLPILLSSMLFVLVFLTKLGVKRSNLRPKLPPGPRKLPLLGNVHQLFGEMPHRRLRDLASKYGPLMHLQLGEVPTIIVSSPEMAEQIMKVHDLSFASRPRSLKAEIVLYNSQDVAFAPYGDLWRQLRKLCIVELFSVKSVQQFRSIREEDMSNLVQAIGSSEGFPVNLSKMLYTSAYNIIIKALIGKNCKDGEKFIDITERTAKLFGGFSVVDLFPSSKLLQVLSGMKSKLERLHKNGDKILESIIQEHKAERESCGSAVMEKDLVHVLLNLQEHGNLEPPLTNDSIKAVIQDLILAGIESSSTAIEWTMSEMLRCPRVLQKAQAEVRQVFDKQGKIKEPEFHRLNYLKLVIKESLRLHPPAPLLLPRQGNRSEINGYEIPAEAQVIVNAWAIGRDPKHWIDPETFNPERFIESPIDFKGTHFELIPFGAGRRVCPGISFGIANIEITLVHLLHHFDWGLPDGNAYEDLDMTETFGISVGRKWDLFVVPFVHNAP